MKITKIKLIAYGAVFTCIALIMILFLFNDNNPVATEEIPEEVYVDSIIMNYADTQLLDLFIATEYYDTVCHNKGIIFTDKIHFDDSWDSLLLSDTIPDRYIVYINDNDSLQNMFHLPEPESFDLVCDFNLIDEYALTLANLCHNRHFDMFIEKGVVNFINNEDTILHESRIARYDSLFLKLKAENINTGVWISQNEMLLFDSIMYDSILTSNDSVNWKDSLLNLPYKNEIFVFPYMIDSNMYINNQFIENFKDIYDYNGKLGLHINSIINPDSIGNLLENFDIYFDSINRDSLREYYLSLERIKLQTKAKNNLLWLNSGTEYNDTLCLEDITDEFSNVLNNVREQHYKLIYNKDNYIPIVDVSTKFYCINLTDSIIKPFVSTAGKYTEIKEIKYIEDKKANHFIFFNDTNDYEQIEKYYQFIDEENTVLISNSFNLEEYYPESKALLLWPQLSDSKQKDLAQVVFGGQKFESCLPKEFTILNEENEIAKTNKTRIGFIDTSEFQLDTSFYNQIDTIIDEALFKRAFPGCQIVVLHKGDVVYNKSFGYQSYSRVRRVSENDIYDLASVTKVAATTMAAMKMVNAGKFKLNDRLEKYFKDTSIEYTNIKPDTIVYIDTFNLRSGKPFKVRKNADTIFFTPSTLITVDTVIKKKIPKWNTLNRTFNDLLTHKSGFSPAAPIVRYVLWPEDTVAIIPDSLKNDSTLTRRDTIEFSFQKYFSYGHSYDSSHFQVAYGMFLKNKYVDTIWRDMKQVLLYNMGKYLYSDMNFLLLQMTMDTINGYPMNKYLYENYYKPLGLHHIGYKPLYWYSSNHIIPTANDLYFRRQLLRGYVHDETAALFGGMAGNAGLYSNAMDLAVLFQMVLNGGEYGGKRYLPEYIVNSFTASKTGGYSGLGFKKKDISKSLVSKDISGSSFGHDGYTGNVVWVDPEYDLVYIFLSNRAHPNPKNWTMLTLDTSNKVHQVFYDAIKSYKEKEVKSIK
jgi:CubicO group peptidase (beta-lactamase class C family)